MPPEIGSMKRWLASTTCLVAALGLAFFLNQQAIQGDSAGANAIPRTLVFISDMHLGVGRDANGNWYKIEDGRWAKEFRAFLDNINQADRGATDLVLNGDTFELWQSLKPDCVYWDANHQNRDLGCTENDELARIRLVLAQHTDELAALRHFANSDDNRVVIVPGNHDAGLLFPGVAQSVLNAVGARADRLRIASQDGYWLSPDGLVYAEHGHQIGEEVNRFDNWPKPFIESNGQLYLQRPWGEQFVQAYFNNREEHYPIIDNIVSESDAVRYGLAADGLSTPADAIAFLGFFLFDVSWKQLTGVLAGKEAPPQWNFAEIRADGDQFIVDSIPSDSPMRAIVQRALKDKKLPLSVSLLSDKQITEICDRRAILLDAEQKAGQPPTITSCPKKQLGAISEQLLRTYNLHFQQHLEQIAASLKTSRRSGPFRVFVYSHTHIAERPFTPLADSDPDWNPLVVNTGAWQRVVNGNQLADIKDCTGKSNSELLRTLMPEDLPPCYSVVIVKPYTDGDPAPALYYWEQDHGGDWTLVQEDACSWKCVKPKPTPSHPR